MIKKKILKGLAVCIFLSLMHQLSADNWIIACEPFEFNQKNNLKNGGNSQLNSQISTLLPQLVLEQLSQSSIRMIPSQEKLDRELNQLQTDRLSLFLQLSKESRARDSLVLTTENPRSLKKAIAQAEEKIHEIEVKIEENLSNVSETEKKYEPYILAENGDENSLKNIRKMPFAFFTGEQVEVNTQEAVSLYKNDTSTLLTVDSAVKDEGISSYAYKKFINDQKINGLLNGKITVFGEYASVSVDLYNFPKGSYVDTVTEVGNINDLISIARRISHNLAPKIANSMPVRLKFNITPQEVMKTAVVTIDGSVTNVLEEIVLDAGIHNISISAPAYQNEVINYNFSGDEKFQVDVTLQPVSEGALSIRLRKYRDGVFYFNGSQSHRPESKENPEVSVSVNGKSVLAIFTEDLPPESQEKAQSAFIYVPQNKAVDGKSLVVNSKPFDRAKNIDKRRKGMYLAYSALVCSLPYTYYNLGNFTSANNAYNAKRGTFEDAYSWQQKTFVSIGISSVCGAWFVIEMIRYLYAANQVLPDTAR